MATNRRFALLYGMIMGLIAGAQGRAQNLDSLLEAVRVRYDLPAVAAAVINHSGTIASGAVGVRKYGDSTRVTLDDRFHLGSCTKAMTAVVIAALIDQGKLSWGSTIGELFPEMRVNASYRKVTLEQLLAHRGGLSEESWPPGMSFGALHAMKGTLAEQRLWYTAAMLGRKPEAKPGKKFIYSNAGYVIAAAMAERRTGSSWEELIRTMLFEPLGMTTAGFGAMGRAGSVEQPWQHTEENGAHSPIEPGPLSDNPPVIAPAGTVHCSIGDWGKFIAACLSMLQGTDGVVKAATLRKAMEPGFGGEYSLGWMVTRREWAGGPALTHAGSNNQNFAVVWLAPLKDLAVIVATNQGGEKVPLACDEVAGTLIMGQLKK